MIGAKLMYRRTAVRHSMFCASNRACGCAPDRAFCASGTGRRTRKKLCRERVIRYAATSSLTSSENRTSASSSPGAGCRDRVKPDTRNGAWRSLHSKRTTGGRPVTLRLLTAHIHSHEGGGHHGGNDEANDRGDRCCSIGDRSGTSGSSGRFRIRPFRIRPFRIRPFRVGQFGLESFADGVARGLPTPTPWDDGVHPGCSTTAASEAHRRTTHCIWWCRGPTRQRRVGVLGQQGCADRGHYGRLHVLAADAQWGQGRVRDCVGRPAQILQQASVSIDKPQS